jgi:mono/diheme cytochrome c family protein
MPTTHRIPLHWKIALALGGLALLAAALPLLRPPKIDYNTQVKPILNKHCIACHGGVKRQGGFSLLTREEALAPTESGRRAIVPGDPDASEMMRRLTCSDPEERMPYRKAPLSSTEIATLRRWIAQGAAWELHWAYRPVTQPDVPRPVAKWGGLVVADASDWPRNDLDWFVLQRLQAEKLQPSPEAERAVLAQRVSMDLIGLPAPDSLTQKLLNDTSSTAYERLVDTLLASPRFGERWASMWLDLARYADTKGYERDSRRFIWRWRDWVIRAFNADMPYDQFLTEQIAGDLLPHPTDAQLIATGFHRNTMTNDEGGTDNEEFRTAAVLDRVNTTWEAVMGTTFACVQCHSHPYDPFHHEEYYQFAAFFNNTRDEDTWEEYPALRHFKNPDDSLRLLRLSGWLAQHTSAEKVAEIERFVKTWQPAYYSIATDSFRNCDLYDTKWLTMRNRAQARLKNVELTGKSQLIWRHVASADGGRLTLRLGAPDGPVLVATKVRKTKDREIQVLDIQKVEGKHDVWFCYENPTFKTPDETGLTFDWLRFTEPLPGQNTPGWAAANTDFWHLLRAESDFTPILLECPSDMARATHVFERGNWLVPAQVVQPRTPRILPPMPAGAPPDRLGLAQWLTDEQNPLTARTLANRVWEQIFGIGLAETLEDLGSQGIAPTHPALLDHLAWRLMHEHHWSLKKLLRNIVLSATYRQDSRTTPALLERDPRNQFLARGPRVRLSAEQLRDKTLAVAGILSTKMYGEGVMPFQPVGIWKSPWSGDYWKQSEGENQYRRAVYTFVKRGSPYPSMTTFDVASREVCSARRIRTNTPLQALTILNDSTFVDLARIFAQNIEKEYVADFSTQIKHLYARAIGREISAEKLSALVDLHQKAAAIYREKPSAAAQLLGIQKPAKGSPPTGEQAARAALVVVANAVLNLDEFVVKS